MNVSSILLIHEENEMLHKLTKKKRGKQQLMPLRIYLFVGVVADQGKKKARRQDRKKDGTE